MEERLSIAIWFKPLVPSLRIVGAAREAREARESAALAYSKQKCGWTRPY